MLVAIEWDLSTTTTADHKDCSSRTKMADGQDFFQITCTAPVNIAVIKYWGKRDEKLVLPLNSSLSVTLCQDQLCTTTTVAASSHFQENCLWLNGRENNFNDPRIQKCLSRIKELAQEQKTQSKWEELKNCHIHICSKNNFPTAAGLASSAAGYACLAFSLAKLFQVDCELSSIARLGSGSACRSIYGGFVKWNKGVEANGSDSKAEQVASMKHWPDLRILVLVVNDQRKITSSSDGMRRSTETSDLLQFRAKTCVPERISALERAIKEKDFQAFAEITMKDSNQFHAVCQDTYPPIEPPYMNMTSHKIVQLVTQYNEYYQRLKAAYTFDAGPNAVLFLLESDVPQMVALVKHFFPPSSGEGFVRGICTVCSGLSEALVESISVQPSPEGTIKYIISTKVGDGPLAVATSKDSLLNKKGLPNK